MRQHGFFLLEILICLSLISIFFASIAYYQTYQQRQMASVLNHSIARAQINYLQQRLLVTPSHTQSKLINDWNQENAQVLPEGKGQLLAVGNEKIIRIVYGRGDLDLCHNQCIEVKWYA